MTMIINFTLIPPARATKFTKESYKKELKKSSYSGRAIKLGGKGGDIKLKIAGALLPAFFVSFPTAHLTLQHRMN